MNDEIRAEIDALKERVRRLEENKNIEVRLVELSDKIEDCTDLVWMLVDDLAHQKQTSGSDQVPSGSDQVPTPDPTTIRTRLAVTLPNGEEICDPKAVDTWVKTIDHLGVDRVKNLNIKTHGHFLVSTERPALQHRPLGPYFIVTHSSTARKKEFLDRIARALGESLQVDIIPV